MNCLLVMKIKWSLDINTGAVERSEAARARRLTGATVALKMYSIHAHKGSHSCLEGVTYGANDRGVTGAWESFVPLTLVSVPDPFPIFFIRMRNKGGGGERKGSGDTAYPSADPGMSTILICGYYSSVRARVRPLL